MPEKENVRDEEERELSLYLGDYEDPMEELALEKSGEFDWVDLDNDSIQHAREN